MEISVRTRLRSDNSFAFDLHIEDMCVDNLPSFSVDEIREMVKPQLELILRNYGSKNDEYVKKVSHNLVYGNQPSLSTCQEDKTNHSGSANADTCTAHQ